MTFAELAEKRQSCREYTDEKVPREMIDQIFTIVRNSPSGCNGQPWKFVVVDDDEKRKAIAPFLQDAEVVPTNGFINDVPTLIVVLEMPSILLPGIAAKYGTQHYAQMDIGLAAAHLVLAAEDMGIATCITGWYDEEKVKEILGIPEEAKIRMVIAMGYAKDTTVRRKMRKPASRIYSYNEYK